MYTLESMDQYSSYMADTSYDLNRIEPMTGIDETVKKVEIIQAKLDNYEVLSDKLNNNYNQIIETRDKVLTHPTYLKYPPLKQKYSLADAMYKDVVIQSHVNRNILLLSGVAIATLLVVSATR